MSSYTVKLTVSVDVEFSIDATSQDSVKQLIDDKLIMSADLVDASSVDFYVMEDSIVNVEYNEIYKED